MTFMGAWDILSVYTEEMDISFRSPLFDKTCHFPYVSTSDVAGPGRKRPMGLNAKSWAS
jgi:hypothetical protein